MGPVVFRYRLRYRLFSISPFLFGLAVLAAVF